jgi:hypothetical protein|tara:strand:- start:83 stop:859 length:777 start_codon:yes stop_codon:yes gene_type:complete
MENLLSETKANYVYLMKNFDRLGRDIGELATDKKIGKSVNPPQREKQLNPTKHPLGIALFKCWRTDDSTHQHEKGIHAMLADWNVDGEWFSDIDDTLTGRLGKYMEIWGCKEVDLGTDEDPGVNRIRKEQMSKDVMRAYFDQKKEEYPEWFLRSCETYAHTLGTFTKYYVLVQAENTNGPFTTEIVYKNKSKNGLFKDEDTFSPLISLLGPNTVVQKKKVYVKTNTFEEAFGIYKTVVTAGKDGDIDLNSEITDGDTE